MPAQEAMPEVDPIPQDPKAFLEKDYQKEEREWAERSLLQPAQERWKNEPWAEEATVLVKEVLHQRELESAQREQCLKALAPKFRALLDQGARDPLLCFFAAQALFDEKLDWRDAKQALQFVEDRRSELNAAGVSYLLGFAIGQQSLGGWDPLSEQVELWHATIQAIHDGSYTDDETNVFVRHQIAALDMAAPQNPDDIVRWQQALQKSSWPEWAKLTLEGAGEVDLAWLKRSGGWASDVSEEQWRGFAAHLKKARDLLARANRLRPDRPEAAAQMITVCLGESVDLAELRSWFDRAVSAQFDYIPAYQSLLWAYRPRWLGSHEHMLTFGKACADTRRYDTAVPSRLMVACTDVAEEIRQAEAVFRHDLVKKAISEMSQGYLQAQGTPPGTHAMRVSNAAMCTWLAGDYPLAKQALSQAGPVLHRTTRQYLSKMFNHEKLMRADVAATTGEYGEAMQKAATLPADTSPEELQKQLAAIDEKGLSPAALDYLKEGKDLVNFQADLNKGEWVKVTPRQHLSAFYVTGGEWSADQGDLVMTGRDERWAEIFLRVPTQDDLEMRGEIVFDIPQNVELPISSCGFGSLLRWLPDGVGSSEGGVRYMIFMKKERSTVAKAYGLSSSRGTPERVIKVKPVNAFHVTMARGKVSYELNEESLASGFSLNKMDVDNDVGFIGFVGFAVPSGAQIRVKNIEVRQVQIKTKEPSVVKKPTDSAAVKRTQESAKEDASDRSIQWAILAAVLVGGFFILRLVKPSEG